HDLHIAGKGRFLFLVAHLELRRFDLDRLIAVLRKALHRIGYARHRALRAGAARREQCERKGHCGETARRKLHHQIISDWQAWKRIASWAAAAAARVLEREDCP